MTHFEYVAIAPTLILTFAAARLLAGLADVLDPPRFYWVHLSWISLAAMFCLTSFWAFWAYRDVQWTLPRLIILLATPALIYVFSSLLVPSDPSGIASWREYFYKARLPIFGSGVLLVLSIIFSNQTQVEVSALDSTQIGLYACLAFFSIGAYSRNPRIHSFLALAPPLMITWMLVDMAPADWFSR